MNLNPTVISTDSGEFSNPGAVTVNNAATYVEILRLAVPRRTAGGALRGELAIRGLVGAGGALAHFKITAAVTAGGTHFDLLADSDFDTATSLCPHAGPSVPPAIHQTAASADFNVLLGQIGAYAELGFHAKKATTDTTLSLSGRIR